MSRKQHRGFAAMSAEKQREIAGQGGRAAHAKGTAHEWTQEEAREAGRRGGQAAQKARLARRGEREAACAPKADSSSSSPSA